MTEQQPPAVIEKPSYATEVCKLVPSRQIDVHETSQHDTAGNSGLSTYCLGYFRNIAAIFSGVEPLTFCFNLKYV